ncbi:MAG: single-stranded-DNA-specific exonuclease RecJ [Liquorilactobacillus satsumensis]|uniref:single-stranded-DNA-specific exonuclease RecJ n=1 Tax=Liquorilactobacillus satsumensis TaxID=259059 RepID=UPI0039E76535
MFESRYVWKQNQVTHDPEKIAQIEQQFAVGPFVAGLLLERGLGSKEELDSFLHPRPENLVDPFLMHDMHKAVDRIQTAIIEGQKITIYGDYDADGITSTAVMYETLVQLGADVHYYLPDRFIDGYGPNQAAYQKIITAGTQLIITVDNGVSGMAAITAAQTAGVDVIITDHHELPLNLPKAFAIVHPRHPAQPYPTAELAGVGVAFKVACALLDEVPQELLDLVAIGTVADLVPLTGENRMLVQFGLQALQQTQRLGLQALMRAAQITPQTVNEQKIGFTIAPRLNSLGRLESATPGVRLLTTLDETEATQIAAQTEKLNQKRQKLVEKITAAALEKLDAVSETHLVNVIAAPDWHEGVLGIVASRLVEKTGKPTLVLRIDADRKSAKGSGRSVEAFHLFKALDVHRKLFQSFGGHHMACGLSLDPEQLPMLQTALDEEAQKQKLELDQKGTLEIAAQLSLDEIDENLLADLKKLAPFGPENPQPVFAFKDYQLHGLRLLGQKQNHVKLTLTGKKTQIEALAFSIEDQRADLLQDAASIEFVGKIEENTWRGQTKPQILICDLADRQPAFLDLRTKRLTPQLFTKNGTYFFFNQRIQQKLAGYLPPAAVQVTGLESLPAEAEFSELFVVDCPPSLTELEQLLQTVSYTRLTAIFYPYKPVYEVGMPTRAQLARVYRFAITHENIDLKNQLQEVADYLKIRKELLTFTLQVFFEVGFVKIEKGLMTGCPAHQTVNLKEAPSYRSRQQLLQAEKVLLTSKTADLKKWLFQLSAV